MKQTETPRNAKINRVLERSEAHFNENFWEHLFEPLREMLISRLSRLFPKLSRADIEDVADETILRLYKYFDVRLLDSSSEEQRRKSFYAFVGRTLYSALSDVLRQNGTIQQGEVSSVSPKSPLNESPSREARPISTEQVTDALRQLKPDAQQLLLFKVVDGLTYREIQQLYAEQGQEISIDALKMRTLRAMAELRRVANSKFD